MLNYKDSCQLIKPRCWCEKPEILITGGPSVYDKKKVTNNERHPEEYLIKISVIINA